MEVEGSLPRTVAVWVTAKVGEALVVSAVADGDVHQAALVEQVVVHCGREHSNRSGLGPPSIACTRRI